jgi:GTP-binding protein
VKKNTQTMVETIKLIRQQFKYLSWAPIVFVSANDNKRIHTIFETILKIEQQLNITISSSLLNDVILKAQIANPPPNYKGGRATFDYVEQVKGQIPTFVIYGNDPKYIHLTYSRYIENQIRHAFEIDIVPITIYFKDKNARIRGIKKGDNV